MRAVHESPRSCERASGVEKAVTLPFLHETGERLGKETAREEI